MSKQYSSIRNKFQSSELAGLINRMQKNTDRVEKTILQSEELLSVDRERERRNMTLIHQRANANNLTDAEKLLKELLADVEKSKKLQHPQADEIEKDVRNLYDLWVKDCATFRNLYNQSLGVDQTDTVTVRRNVEVIRPQRTITVQNAPANPRDAESAGDLDRILRALEQCQEQILGRLRTPLDKRSPTQDLANRLRELEKSAQTVRKLESEKTAIQREMGPILSRKPLGPSASALPLKLTAIDNKIEDINALIDLYKKKASASLTLEKQIQSVESFVSGCEEQLAKDGVIYEEGNAPQTHYQQLQYIRKNVNSKEDELSELGRDLELAEQACRPLQWIFNEYCPDIHRQEDNVKKLKNRQRIVNNQLQKRSALLKAAITKYQDFQNAYRSLDFFLVNLPNISIRLTDDVTQIRAKHSFQTRVMEDIWSKSSDVEHFRSLSRDLQRILHEYEVVSRTYRAALRDDDEDEDDNNTLLLRRRLTLAQAVHRQESNLLSFYYSVSAEYKQLLSQLDVARTIVAKKEEKVSQVIVTKQVHLQREHDESVSLKNQLSEEIERRLRVEKSLETYHSRLLSLRGRRGVERVEETEVVQYYRDPKLEAELLSMKKLIQEESLKRTRYHSEIETFREKMIKVELQVTRQQPKLLSKVITQCERDILLDKEAAVMRDEMQRIRLEIQTRESKIVNVRTEITVLTQQRPKIRERVVRKEVVRIEKDPEMLNSVHVFKSDIATIESRCKVLNESIYSIRSQITSLERLIPTIQPRVVTKVVMQVQQDAELVEEAKRLRIALEEERNEISILIRDMSTLQLRYTEVQKVTIKVEVKEIVKEVFVVTPELEAELVRLRKELQEWSLKRTHLETEIRTVTTSTTTLHAQKPIVEYREVTQEVIKEENSPEVIRELQRITNQYSRVKLHYDTTLELLIRLQRERDELKIEKSKVETRIVTRELIKYVNDPNLEREVERLRRIVTEEIHLCRRVEESVIELRSQYVVLESQKIEERIVVHEVVRLQKDPQQILEHERLSRLLLEETRARKQLETEVRQFRTLIEERRTSVVKMDEHHIKIQLETELRQIKSRIYEIESTPIEEKIIIKEVFQVERDPQLEILIQGLRANLETERSIISRLESDTRNLTVRLEVLQKEKSVERVVYKEIVHIEKDPTVEKELAHLRELVAQERHLRISQEENIKTITVKISHIQKSVSSQEETILISNRDLLWREKEELLRQLKMLESERQSIMITFERESRLVSERNQIAQQMSLKISSEVEYLEKEILILKEKIQEKEALIIQLLNSIKMESHAETHKVETNLSTKITIMDPETGKDMSPYEAFVQGLITRDHYIRLSKLECHWEEITSSGLDGDTTILQDRKSGKQYSIQDALRDGRLTQHDFMRYKEGKMHISEFAILVVGEIKEPDIPPVATSSSLTTSTSVSNLSSMQSSLRTSYTSLNTYHSSSLNNIQASTGDEHFPICGIFDTTTGSQMSVRSALTRKLIDSDTALKLLEAQAASGGIVDLTKKDKLSVHKSVEHGLIDQSQLYKLLNAQKAFTGVEDPVTKERIALGLGVQKGYMPQESARRFMEAQYLTGGLVNPARAGRITVQDARAAGLIDSRTAEELLNESLHTKELVDPITKEKISYKQAMDRCKRDTNTGLLLLPVASTDASNAPSYSNYRFNSY